MSYRQEVYGPPHFPGIRLALLLDRFYESMLSNRRDIQNATTRRFSSIQSYSLLSGGKPYTLLREEFIVWPVF